MRHEGVDQRRGRSLLALARSEGLPERALYESVFLVGDRRFDIFAQRFADALGFQIADRGPFGPAAAAAQLLLDLPVAFEHLHRIVAGRKALGSSPRKAFMSPFRRRSPSSMTDPMLIWMWRTRSS